MTAVIDTAPSALAYTEPSPVALAYAEQFAIQAGRLIATLEATPDDQLNWRPAPAAKSALQIAAHCAVANRYFIDVISGRPMASSPGEAQAAAERQAQELTNRGDVLALLQETHKTLLDLYSCSSIETALSDEKRAFYVAIPFWHTATHAGQIDYLQTCWGDLEDHFQPLSAA